jgi:hypothetical protein
MRWVLLYYQIWQLPIGRNRSQQIGHNIFNLVQAVRPSADLFTGASSLCQKPKPI